jgi:tetratricopeptide (TPR) repeat protein
VADHVGGPHGLTQSLATRLGDLALSQGRCDAAGARYREALARAGWHGNGRHVALIRTRLGDAARCRGDAVAALVHYERALAVCRGANIIERQPDIYLALGDLHREQGQYEQALALYRQGLAKAELTDTAADQAALLHRVGLIQRLRGDRAGARERFEAARAHYRRVATPSTDQARLLADLGGLHQAEGRYYHALRYYTEALATWQAAGPAGVAATGAIEMSALARALIDEGEADLACIHYQEVLVLTLGQRRAAAPVPPLPPMPPDISDPAN